MLNIIWFGIVVGIILWIVGANNIKTARDATRTFVDIGTDMYKENARIKAEQYYQNKLKKLK